MLDPLFVPRIIPRVVVGPFRPSRSRLVRNPSYERTRPMFALFALAMAGDLETGAPRWDHALVIVALLAVVIALRSLIVSLIARRGSRRSRAHRTHP